MELLEELRRVKPRALEQMFDLRSRTLETPDADVHQFLNGFVNLVIASAQGDHGPRDHYLESVIPSIKAAGMPLASVMDGLTRVTIVLANQVHAEHIPWLVEYLADYTRRLTEIWERE